MATIPPLEILEAAYPIRFTEWSLRTDSGGPGRHRGGLGAVYEIELLESHADGFLFGERGRFAPPGVLGGGHGALNRFRYQNDGVFHEPPMVSKMTGIELQHLDRVRLETPGGGGFGVPFERDTAAVAQDVRLGLVSVEAARQAYGVAIDSSGSIDAAQTTKLRAQAAAAS
jgi:N-methylhydantoinase B